MTRVLVTGASGFLGRHVVPVLVSRGDEVVAPSHRDLALENLTPEALRARADGQIDTIVHLAARLDNPFGVDFSLTELAAANVVGTLRLLEAAAVIGIRRFVHGSTGGVGTNPPHGSLMREDDPAGPVNAYGLTKHLAEQAVRAYAWPFERVSLRYFAPYGRDGSNPMFRHLLDHIARGEPIDLPPDGGAILNPVHIDDAVEATLRAMVIGDPPSVVNVAGPDAVSMRDLAELLGEAIGRPPVVRDVDGPSLNWVADIARQSAVVGRPRIGLREGILREFGRA